MLAGKINAALRHPEGASNSDDLSLQGLEILYEECVYEEINSPLIYKHAHEIKDAAISSNLDTDSLRRIRAFIIIWPK